MGAFWSNQLLFSIGILTIVSSLCGNALVIFALTFKKRTRLPAFNILMLGQAAISLMDICCNMPLTTASSLINNWPLDRNGSNSLHLCRFHAFFNSVIPSCRIVLIAMMALDRVVAIFSPVSYPDRVTRERAWCMVIYCWLHASAIYISMLAGATPVIYREKHYSCLIASSAVESYVIVMVSFGYVIPVIFTSLFLLMILKKYVVQEPVVSVVEDLGTFTQTGDCSANDNRLVKKRHKIKSNYKSVTDYEVAAYVALLYLVWLVCQSPLFVTLTSDLILSNTYEKLTPLRNETISNITVTTQTTTNRANVTRAYVIRNETNYSHINMTSSAIADTDAYQQMFPPEFQTTVQFLNFLPSIVTPVLTFILYRSVWSRLKHVIAKSRFARRHHRAFSIEDEDMSSFEVSRPRSFVQATTVGRSRQRVRHRNRMTTENLGKGVTNSGTPTEFSAENCDSQRPSSRLGTPVLMATSDGLLLQQVVRTRSAVPESEVGHDCVADENCYFKSTITAENDTAQVENDAMTSSCNSTKHLLQACDIRIESSVYPAAPSDALKGNASEANDSGIEDSPTSKLKCDPPECSVPDNLDSQMALPTGQILRRTTATSASNIRPVLSNNFDSVQTSNINAVTGTALHPVLSQGLVANIGEKARNSVNSTVRRILGSASPKSKYRADVFTVSQVTSDHHLTSLTSRSFTSDSDDLLRLSSSTVVASGRTNYPSDSTSIPPFKSDFPLKNNNNQRY